MATEKEHGDLVQGQLERCRRLSDTEISAIRRDCPTQLAFTVGRFFSYHAPVDRGYSQVQEAANRFIEDHKLDETVQAIFWRGVALMNRTTTGKTNDGTAEQQFSIL